MEDENQFRKGDKRWKEHKITHVDAGHPHKKKHRPTADVAPLPVPKDMPAI